MQGELDAISVSTVETRKMIFLVTALGALVLSSHLNLIWLCLRSGRVLAEGLKSIAEVQSEVEIAT